MRGQHTEKMVNYNTRAGGQSRLSRRERTVLCLGLVLVIGVLLHQLVVDPFLARKKRVERFGIRFDVHSPTKSFRIVDELVLRSYTPRQMNQLIRSSGCWETVETFSFGYDLDDPVEVDGTSEDVVYVLRRTSTD